MKKILFTVFCFILISTTALANVLDFKPVGNGKFIYCNNPEAIVDDILLNSEEPRWIMNNENLTPDNYYIYLSHFNYTGNTNIGYDIELDMGMIAKQDSKITIHKAFFQTPESYAYLQNGIKTITEADWAQLNVCANMLDMPMCAVRGNEFYYPESFNPVTLELKQGEIVWLSEYLSDYKPVSYGKGVHIQGFIEIESGVMDFNVGAIKSGEDFDIRQNLPEKINFGEYRWDYTLKGIADTLPEVYTNISYTIDETTENNTKIPVLLKNQYVPEGHTVTEWFTQLNPQSDIWSKPLAAESDILTLFYKDDAKLDFYGSAVPDSKKDNVWQFNTTRSSVKKYEPRFNTGEEKDFIPNFVLTTDTENHTYACSIGNYGVTTTYRMSVTNKTSEPKYCSLVITAAGEIIAYKTEHPYAYVKDFTAEKVTDNMLSHKIPPNSTEEFEFSIILPVNYNSGIKNALVITDENIQSTSFEEKKAELENEHKITNYKETNVINGSYLNEIYDKLPKKTTQIIPRGEYEYISGKDEIMVRWCAWDGKPNWYYNHWNKASTVYMLNKDYEIINSFTFSSLPTEASFDGDYFYIKTARDGAYKSENGVSWLKTDAHLPEYVPYYDLENASPWAISELKRSWEEGLRLKPLDSGYKLTDEITREDFCELSFSLLKKTNLTSYTLSIHPFSDTTNEKIEALASLGIINGFEDKTFRPDESLTREQAAVILARFSRQLYGEGINLEYQKHIYNDHDLISDWALIDVNIVHDMGIMNGIGNNTFAPKDSYSREQSVATILRLYDKIR